MTEKQERNIYTTVCFSMIISVISILLSIVVMLRYNYRIELGLDYLGAIVAIVSLAIAIFVGVQIYHSFTLKREIEEQNKRLLNDAKESFTNSISNLDKRLNQMDKDIENRCGECKSYVDTQIQIERKIAFLNDFYKEAMNTSQHATEGWKAFKSFCRIASQSKDTGRKIIMEQALQRADEVKDKFEDKLKEEISKDKNSYEVLKDDLVDIDMEEARDIIEFIEECLNTTNLNSYHHLIHPSHQQQSNC